MKFARIMIAGVQSGVGKTTLTLGILAALKDKGIKVQPYKVGPDYIDSGLHFHAAGVKSHNLDSWMGTKEVIQNIFCRNSQTADVSVVEGVMGLFDGAKGEGIKGSSAHIAKLLGLPVVLVVNVKGMGRSCLAMLKGFKEFEPGLNVAGVILNNAGADYYRKYIKQEIEQELGLKVLGCLPRNTDLVMPERHLGLLPAEENPALNSAIQVMARQVEEKIDLEGLVQIARTAPKPEFCTTGLCTKIPNKNREVTIGIARDEAFSFYYQDNLDYLAELGVSPVFFSPLRDDQVPRVDGLYLGGGFPEMFLEQLSGNRRMMESIRKAFHRGVPIWAECGGLMYLTETIVDFQGQSWPGVGLVPGNVRMTGKLAALGYVKAVALNDSVLAAKGDELKGHEFHYSVLSGSDSQNGAFWLEGGKRATGEPEGYVNKNLIASYLHLHLRSNPGAAARLVEACRQYRQSS